MRLYDLPYRFLQAYRDIPSRIVFTHLGEIGDVADVIADAVVIDVLIDLFLAREFFGDRECFPNGTRIGATATNVIDLRNAGGLDEFLDEAGDVA